MADEKVVLVEGAEVPVGNERAELRRAVAEAVRDMSRPHRVKIGNSVAEIRFCLPEEMDESVLGKPGMQEEGRIPGVLMVGEDSLYPGESSIEYHLVRGSFVGGGTRGRGAQMKGPAGGTRNTGPQCHVLVSIEGE